jgi:hypothetical protein
MAVLDRSMLVEQQLPDFSPVVEIEDSEAAALQWSPGTRILFRFVFLYLSLYILGFFAQLLGLFPYAGTVGGWYQNLWSGLVPWVSMHLFHAEAPVRLTGSGDAMFHWVQVFCFLVLALTATVVWTLLDRRRPHYARLYEWLKVYVRFGLALAMMMYGGFKIIPSQFPSPSLDRLMQPFGDASPMGLLWTFMGASAPYTIFAGLTEWLGGVLLVFRRTALLGALVCVAALTNVVMLNFCYDVPVKLFSSHLLLLAIVLVAPHLRRLADLLVLNRPAPAAPEPRQFQRRWLRLGARAFQVLFAAGISLYVMYLGQERLTTYYSSRSPLRGIWSVDTLQVDGQASPPRGVEALQWKRVIFDYPSMVAVQLTNDSPRRYGLELDAAKKTMALAKRDDPTWKSAFSYEQPTPGRLTLAGTFEGRKVQASLHRVKEPEFLLVTRGFHWVNEYPFNR